MPRHRVGPRRLLLSCALQGTALSPSSVPQLRLQVWVGEAGAGYPTRRPAPLGPAPVPAALTSAARQELQVPTGTLGQLGPSVCGARAYPPHLRGAPWKTALWQQLNPAPVSP